MTKMKTVKLPPIYKLSSKFEEKIGHIIVAYAFLEHLLSQAIYDLLGIGPKEGRLAVGEPKLADRFDILIELLHLRKIKLEAKVDEISKIIQSVQTGRNNIAHRIWLEHPNTLETFIQLTKNTWRPDPKGKKVKRAISPEGLRYGEKELSKLYEDIDKLTAEVLDMLRELAYQLSKKEKETKV